jgi:hypothetical protein
MMWTRPDLAKFLMHPHQNLIIASLEANNSHKYRRYLMLDDSLLSDHIKRLLLVFYTFPISTGSLNHVHRIHHVPTSTASTASTASACPPHPPHPTYPHVHCICRIHSVPAPMRPNVRHIHHIRHVCLLDDPCAPAAHFVMRNVGEDDHLPKLTMPLLVLSPSSMLLLWLSESSVSRGGVGRRRWLGARDASGGRQGEGEVTAL